MATKKRKTEEVKGQYASEIEDSAENAAAMLGKGYEPAYEIHKGETVIQESKEGQKEYTTGVWVKIAAPFRNKHLKALKGSKLGVWLCLVLHINEKNNSHPSIETICKETGYSNREVIDCIRELEKGGYLSVIRGAKKYNIYHVNFGAAYGKGNTPTCEESSQVKSDAKKVGKKTRQSSLKEEPVIKEEPIKEGASPATPTPPEIALYRTVTKKFPPSPNNEDVIAFVQGVARRLGREVVAEDLRPFYKAWTANGWNQFSINWLEYAVKGVLPSTKKTTFNVGDALRSMMQEEPAYGNA
jgi:hypothetical protein